MYIFKYAGTRAPLLYSMPLCNSPRCKIYAEVTKNDSQCHFLTRYVLEMTQDEKNHSKHEEASYKKIIGKAVQCQRVLPWNYKAICKQLFFS